MGCEAVNPQDFDGALKIRHVGRVKLTQALFLINSSEFLPCDDKMDFLVDPPNTEFDWAHYREWLQKVRDLFPGCAYYEINLFSYLYQKGNLSVREKYFQISTRIQGGKRPDFWEMVDPEREFARNNWVFTTGPRSGTVWKEYDPRYGHPKYPVGEPRPGDVMLVRTGLSNGRGIGIVYKNDYRDRLAEDSRIHVLWVNKESAKLSGMTQLSGFDKVSDREKTLDSFRQAPAYAKTFELLARLSREQPVAKPEARHPLNQILYGPPGTGKTYHTVDRALAIIDGEKVRAREEDDIERFNYLRDSDQIAFVTFHQNFAYEDFIEGIRPTLDDGDVGHVKYELRDGIFKQIARTAERKRESNKRFVLIIDEINRGNIAKIFGELITLIEDSRRLGADDETEVSLPYSRELFGIPDNLYLIGTMNTADRSIQLLDTALRRRFDFVEMMPEPEHNDISTDVEGVDCQRMLKVINERITALLDREHQIGHTYLLDVKTIGDLSYVFQNKIFPLLQEYFFDDWSKMRTVLGRNSFVVPREVDTSLLDEDQVDENRRIYERLSSNEPQWKDPAEYRNIYSGGSADDTSDR